MTTDTPRTNALIMECPSHLQEVALSNLAMDLERELAASKAEVERLEEQLNHFDNIHCDCVPKLKAEVEKLKALLQEARPVLRHTAMYCLDAVNCICGTEYLGERIDEALNPTETKVSNMPQ